MLIEIISDSKSRTTVHSNGVLYLHRNATTIDLCAMSIIGPEGAVRAIASDCGLAKLDSRPAMFMVGPRHQIKAKWRYGWSCRAMELAPGAMHMVAVGTNRGHGDIVVIPSDPLESTVDAEIYRILRDRFSTPLLPIGSAGQPEWERALAEKWRSAVVRAIRDYRKRRLWQPLDHHPDQKTNPFAGAGLLSLTQAELDQIVSSLAKSGRIQIPEPRSAA